MAKAKLSHVAAALVSLGATLGLIATAQAVCPVCTFAVTTGVGLSRWLGVDDTISGLWIGGVIVSMILWTLSWMEAHAIHFKLKGLITTIAYYLLVCLPLYAAGMIDAPRNRLFGFDKLALGIIIGSLAFYAGAWSYERLRQMNKGRAYFPFQKVAMPVVPLLLLTPILYLVTKGH